MLEPVSVDEGLQRFTVTAWKNGFLKSSLTFPLTIVACQ